MADPISTLALTGTAKTPYYSGSSLPVELWTQIFKEASATPGKNEFSMDPRGYSDIPYDPRVQSSQLTSSEFQVALDTRRMIVLVRKSWYDIGLPVLYSHYRVRLHDEWAGKDPLFQESTRGSRLASYVLRLTIMDTRWKVSAEDQAKLAERNGRIASLVPKLSRLLILVLSPTLYWSIPASFNSTIAIAHFTTRERCIKMDVRHIGDMKGLKKLSLRLDRTSTSVCDLHPISLPSLVSLEVSVGEILGFPVDGEVEYSIVNIFVQWDTPKLHTLSLYSADWNCWKPFIDKNAPGLRVLDIRYYPQHVNAFPKLDLPNLRELYLEPGPRNYYPGSRIHCPRLERAALYRWRSKRYLLDNWTPISQELGFIAHVLERWMTEIPGISYRISGDGQLIINILGESDVVDALGALHARGSYVCVVEDDGRIKRGKDTIEGTKVVLFHDHLGHEYRRLFLPINR